MTIVIVRLVRRRTSIDWRILQLHFPVNYASSMELVQCHQDMAQVVLHLALGQVIVLHATVDVISINVATMVVPTIGHQRWMRS
jgi:hypothetical protein